MIIDNRSPVSRLFLLFMLIAGIFFVSGSCVTRLHPQRFSEDSVYCRFGNLNRSEVVIFDQGSVWQRKGNHAWAKSGRMNSVQKEEILKMAYRTTFFDLNESYPSKRSDSCFYFIELKQSASYIKKVKAPCGQVGPFEKFYDYLLKVNFN